MTLTGNPQEPVYEPGSVPGVGVPREEDDGLFDGLDGDTFDLPEPDGIDGFGETPSIASTIIEKPDLGLTGTSQYFDSSGNYIEMNPIPTTRDYSAEITTALNRLGEATSILGVSNIFNESVVGLMLMPEFVSMINELNTDEMFDVGEPGGQGAQQPQISGKEFLGALAAEAGMQVLTSMHNSSLNRLASSVYNSTDEEMMAAQNVRVFYDEVGPDLDPWMRQQSLTIGSSVATYPFTRSNPALGGGQAYFVSNIADAITGSDHRSYDEFSEGAAVPQVGRNFREELYGSATVRWQEKPPRTQAEKEAYMSWFYAFARQKSNEEKGIESHLGSLTYTLDLPRQGVVTGLNKIINQVAFPNATLDRTHLPAGENLAWASGLSSQDENPSWVFDTPVGKATTLAIDYGLYVALPITAGISVYNVMRGGEPMKTPILTEFWDEFKQSNSFQLAAGGFQLSTFFWADPVNYVAGMGLGYKASQSIPRMTGVSRALQFRRAVTPLRGARLTNVTGGMTARGTQALLSHTVPEMVGLARGGSRQGNRLIAAFRSSDDLAVITRKIPALKGNRNVGPLKRLVDSNDIDGFWDLVELSMSGANEAANPFLFNSIKSKAAIATTELHSVTKRALENGEVGIRDVMTGLYGAHPNSTLYNVAQTSAKKVVNAGDDVEAGAAAVATIVRRGTRGKDRLPTIKTVDLKDGSRMEIRGAGDARFGYDAQTGELLGGIEGGHKANPTVGTVLNHQEKGVNSALRESLPGYGKNRASIDNATAEAQAALTGRGKPRTIMSIADEEANIVAPGAERTIVNYRLGWVVEDGLDKNVIKQIREVDPALADKLENIRDKRALQASAAILEPDELKAVERAIDDVLEGDAIAIGDDIIVSRASEHKLMTGLDITTPDGTLEKLLPQQTKAAVDGSIITDMLEGSQRHVMLIDQMPRPKLAAGFWEKAGSWAGANSNRQTAQFGRRLKAMALYVSPGDIDPSKVKEGLANLTKRLKIHGATRRYTDEVEQAWLTATTNEERYGVAEFALRGVGEDVGAPAIFQAYGDHINRFGETGYGKRATGEGWEEIGSAVRANGEMYVSPTIAEHHQKIMRLPDAYEVEKEHSRFRRAGRLPKQLVSGWGKTNEKRKAIAAAYRKQIIDERGIEGWIALGPTEIAREDVAMSVAFSQMIDHTGQGTGLGKVNSAFAGVNRIHKGFHTTFTLAQLAGRPFAWASRVLMEEHVRGWLAGLPSLASNPNAYLANTWNSVMVGHVKSTMKRQAAQAEVSAKILFGGDMPMLEAIKVADNILPGWSAKMAKSGANLEDVGQVRALWTSMLAKALNNNEISGSVRRAGITNRVLRKQKSLNRVVERHNRQFGFDPRIWNWEDDVPELTGASILRPFGNELEGAIGEMRFTPNLKTRTRAAVAQAHATKAQQVLGGKSGRVAIQRTLQQLRGEAVTYTGERFARTRTWADIRHNIEDVARARGVTGLSDGDLAEWYLDVIMRKDWIEGNFKYLWGDSPGEKVRILDEIATTRKATVRANGVEHTVSMKPKDYGSGKGSWAALFDSLDSAGRHEEVSPVMGVINAYFVEEAADLGAIKKTSNWILQVFGEGASQTLHRRPAYLAERRRNLSIYTDLGWSVDDATQIAHEKAYETVNWLFFNNHHTGELLRRMNKTIPFFSAWAEVMSTWAWKIPSMNVMGVGHAAMIHKIDNIMQGFVRMGIVSIDEDTNQWYMNFDTESASLSPTGRGLSQAGHRMVQTPITAVVQALNIGNWLKTQLTTDEYEAMNLSEWSKDNYKIAIGSPVALGSRGVMGVNQLSFGFTPAVSAGTDVVRDKFNAVTKRLGIAGQTDTIIAPTLADAYDQLPDNVSQAEFLNVNREVIVDRIGLDGYNALFKDGFEFTPPKSVDLSGLPLEMPGSSFFDQVVDPVLYPFGHIDGLSGVIRSVVPSTASYIIRSTLGLWSNGEGFGEGIVQLLTGPLQQYQIDGEVHTAMMHQESTKGTYSKINAASVALQEFYAKIDGETVEDKAKAIVVGSPEAKELADLKENLAHLEDAAAKEASDMAFHATFGRGISGLFGPATPRMAYEDQVFKSEYYATREIAEVMNERGDFDWGPLFDTDAIRGTDDYLRANIEIEKWYNDPSGSETKAFIFESYPSLLAWITPSTYWGAAGSPPLGRDIDITMSAILAGSKQQLPDDVVQQKMWRNVVEAQYESNIISYSGTNDQVEQGRWALLNPDTYQKLKDEKRYSLKSLDWFDDLYNGGNYHKYRDNEEDAASLFEDWEEQLFARADAADDIIEMVNHSGIANDEEQDTVAKLIRATLGAHFEAREIALEDMGIARKFWTEREEFLSEYRNQVVQPYTAALDEAFTLLDDAESAAERGVAFEMVREAQNNHYDQQHLVTFDGLTYRVPSELERKWMMLNEDDKEEQLQEWSGLNVKYLSEFAIDKMVEMEEGFRAYLPWEQRSQNIISAATLEKKALVERMRADHREWSSYESRIALENIEATMQNNLVKAGYPNVVQYMEAWPMERLIVTGTLPPELGQVGSWFMGIHKDLDSIGKTPTSDAGRDMFREFGDMLDVYWLQNPDQEEKWKEVGTAMFGEDANWSLYYRFADVRFGEAG